MTSTASASLYTAYKRFTVSRVQYWKPKIYANLLQMIRNATAEPTIQQAIKQLDMNMLKPSGIAITLQHVYADAGRVWGAWNYQRVMRQARELISRYEKKFATLIEGDNITKYPSEILALSPLTIEGGIVKCNSIAYVDMSKEAIIPLEKLPPFIVEEKRLMPIGYNEELVNEIISYFRLHLLNEAVMPITDTMKDWIMQKLIEAQYEGRSIQQVADELIKHDFPANRSIVIARTETMKAANFGAVQGAKKSGFQMEKEWISARDIRTRRIPRDEFSHVAMHGKTVPMDQPFLVPNRNGSHDSLMQPLDPKGDAGDVIQCRCTVGFNVVRDARGLPVRQ